MESIPEGVFITMTKQKYNELFGEVDKLKELLDKQEKLFKEIIDNKNEWMAICDPITDKILYFVKRDVNAYLQEILKSIQYIRN
jgi:hypothetical protein